MCIHGILDFFQDEMRCAMLNSVKWWALGMREGYPRCCIRAFVRDMRKGLLPAQEREKTGWKSNGGGFVPCEKCVKTRGGT